MAKRLFDSSSRAGARQRATSYPSSACGRYACTRACTHRRGTKARKNPSICRGSY
jgi:hypothetical protein